MTRELQLRAPGGPLGWPLGGVSHAEALEVLSRTSGNPYVLGIDQARTSGFAAIDPASGKVLSSGVTKTTHEAVDVLESLRALPGFEWESVLVVFEDHAAIECDMRTRARFDPRTGVGPDRSPAVLCGLGDARGRWQSLLDLRAHPKAQRLLAPPRAWRRVVGKVSRSDPKGDVVRWATARLGRPLGSHDEADAIGIATWGAVEGLHGFATDRLRHRQLQRLKRRADNDNDNGEAP